MNGKVLALGSVVLAVIAGIAFYVVDSYHYNDFSLGDFWTRARLHFQDWTHSYTHKHSDFAVNIEGTQFDFNRDKFMTSDQLCDKEDPSQPRSIVHLHDDIGTVVHVHWPGVTWRMFFQSLGGDFNSQCMALDGNTFCSNSENEWRVFVNGRQVPVNGNRSIDDLDKVLFSYGNPNADVSSQLASISDLSKFEGKGIDCSLEGVKPA